MKKILLISTLLLSMSQAEEAKNFYVGAAVNADAYSQKNIFDAFSVNAGYNFNNYLGVETRYMKNIVSNDVFVDDISIFLKPQYNIYSFNMYSLLGYGKMNLKNDGFKEGEYDFKWGIGISYDFKDFQFSSVNVYVDYTSISNSSEDFSFDINDNDLNTLNFGVSYKF